MKYYKQYHAVYTPRGYWMCLGRNANAPINRLSLLRGGVAVRLAALAGGLKQDS